MLEYGLVTAVLGGLTGAGIMFGIALACWPTVARFLRVSVREQALVFFFVAGTPICLGWLCGMIGPFVLTSSYQRKHQTYVRSIERDLASLLSRIKEHGNAPLRQTESARAPAKPFIIVRCELGTNGQPDLNGVDFLDGWDRRANVTSEGIQAKFAPKTIVIVSSRFRTTGRSISLDIGSAPEERDSGFLFILDAQSLEVLWRSSEFMGSPYEKPRLPKLGGGIIYVTSLAGESIGWTEIDGAMTKVPWAMDR